MTVTVTLRERGSNAFLELRSLFISLQVHYTPGLTLFPWLYSTERLGEIVLTVAAGG